MTSKKFTGVCLWTRSIFYRIQIPDDPNRLDLTGSGSATLDNNTIFCIIYKLEYYGFDEIEHCTIQAILGITNLCYKYRTTVLFLEILFYFYYSFIHVKFHVNIF